MRPGSRGRASDTPQVDRFFLSSALGTSFPEKLTITERAYRIESRVSWSEPARWFRTQPAPTQETHHDRSYAHLVHLASPAQRLRLLLHPPRLPPLRRVDHRHGPQRRGTHHHPDGPGPGATRRLEGPGIVRRVRRLAPRPPHLGPDPPDRDRPGTDLARLPRLGRR